MTTIKLYNTRTRRKEAFTPIDPKNVRMYVCGPTVYDRAHLGNARPVIVFDVLYRLLRHVYGPDHVTYVRNFTDVDDKINAEARRRMEAGVPGSMEDLIRGRSDETIAWYLEDMAAVGVSEPTEMPRATEYIGQMVTMISALIALVLYWAGWLERPQRERQERTDLLIARLPLESDDVIADIDQAMYMFDGTQIA